MTTLAAIMLTTVASIADYDLNGDQRIGGADLAAMLAAWGPCADPSDCPADVTGNGWVDGADLAHLLANWGAVWGELHHTGGACDYTMTLTADDPAYATPVTAPSPWPGHERLRLPDGSFIDMEATP